MKNRILEKRLAQLERDHGIGGEYLAVLICRWAGTGGFVSIETGIHSVLRKENETQDEFFARAEAELVALAKKDGQRSPYVLIARRAASFGAGHTR